MSTRDHSTIEELLAVRALGGLDADDEATLERELASHGDCDGCERLEAEFSRVVGRLGLSLDPVPVDPGMADRIIASTSGAPGSIEAASTVDLTDRHPRRGRRWAIAVSIAAAFALVVGGVFVVARGTIPAVPLASEQQVVHFSPTTAGTLSMAYTPGQPGVLLWGSDMKDPGADKVLEVWMIANGKPVSGGCVRPTDGDLVRFSNADLGDATEMAVTVESSSCPGSPTTTPIMTAMLTA